MIKFFAWFRDLEENQSERNTKYRELRKREETMDSFLEGFDANKKEEHEYMKDNLCRKILNEFTCKYNFHIFVPNSNVTKMYNIRQLIDSRLCFPSNSL